MKCRVVNSQSVLAEKRFDGSYHNADVNVYDGIIRAHSDHNLSWYCSSIFTSGRAKRAYTKAQFGLPFLSNADVSSQNPLATCKYSSKKYGYDESAILKGGMILTGRVGAIGQTSFVPKYWERYQMMGSDNIIRIVVKPENKNGFIYAYLASKFGNLSFWKLATGGVQPFITEAMVGKLPIPDFPTTFQEEVDDLIQKSSKLREQATDSLEKAISLIENKFPELDYNPKGATSNKQVIQSTCKRFDASFHLSKGKLYNAYIKEKYQWKPLSEEANITRPNLFKRCYVKKGLALLSGSDIFLAIPNSDKYLSRKTTKDIEQLELHEGCILMPRSGTICQVTFANSQHDKKLGSEDIIRITPLNPLIGGYLFAFLASTIGKSLIQRYIFGSVIQHVEPHLLNEIPIPVFDDNLTKTISSLSNNYKEYMGKAANMELKAISMVEEEIEKWQPTQPNEE